LCVKKGGHPGGGGALTDANGGCDEVDEEEDDPEALQPDREEDDRAEDEAVEQRHKQLLGHLEAQVCDHAVKPIVALPGQNEARRESTGEGQAGARCIPRFRHERTMGTGCVHVRS
jgi:hypothetical protein